MRLRTLLRALAAAGAIAFGGCSLVVDTDGLSGGAAPAPTTVPGEGGADAGLGPDATDGAATDAPADNDAGGDPSLVGDWPFDEGSGTSVHDRSGRGHDGVALGGVWVDDHANGAASAMKLGGSSFVAVNAHADFDRPASARLTLAAWMRMNDTPNHDMFFSISYGEADSSYGIELMSATELTYWDGTQHAAVASIPAIGVDWHHYAVVVDGETVRVYLDGVRVSQGKIDTTPRTATQVLFGRSTFGDRLDGAVDKMRYYRRALTEDEIVAEKNR